jgi:hypothetical protein
MIIMQQIKSNTGFVSDYELCRTASFLINRILAYRCMIDTLDCSYRMHVSGLNFCTHAERNEFSQHSLSD